MYVASRLTGALGDCPAYMPRHLTGLCLRHTAALRTGQGYRRHQHSSQHQTSAALASHFTTALQPQHSRLLQSTRTPSLPKLPPTARNPSQPQLRSSACDRARGTFVRGRSPKPQLQSFSECDFNSFAERGPSLARLFELASPGGALPTVRATSSMRIDWPSQRFSFIERVESFMLEVASTSARAASGSRRASILKRSNSKCATLFMYCKLRGVMKHAPYLCWASARRLSNRKRRPQANRMALASPTSEDRDSLSINRFSRVVFTSG